MKTQELVSALMRTADFDGLCERHADEFMDENLIGYLLTLMERHGASKREMMEQADLDKGYAYQILRGIRKPNRDKLLCIALGLGCDLEETQTLLKLGGRNELYSRVRRDAAVVFCLQRHYSVQRCQTFLASRHFETLRDEG